jgi:hypothetical protein
MPRFLVASINSALSGCSAVFPGKYQYISLLLRDADRGLIHQVWRDVSFVYMIVRPAYIRDQGNSRETD